MNRLNSVVSSKQLSGRAGFTLVEMAIAMVVVSFIVAAVFTGASLQKYAQIRGVMNDINQINTAYNNFMTKYLSRPGDIPNVTTYWPASGIPNGNGNNFIDANFMGCAAYGVYEDLTMWALLNITFMYPGNYTGSPASPGTDGGCILPGTNAPVSSSWPGMYYTIRQGCYFQGDVTCSDVAGIVTYNFILLNGPGPGGASRDSYGIMSSVDAKTLDTKIDDGHANTGEMMSVDNFDSPSGACSSPWDTVGGADYNLSSTIPLGCSSVIVVP